MRKPTCLTRFPPHKRVRHRQNQRTEVHKRSSRGWRRKPWEVPPATHASSTPRRQLQSPLGSHPTLRPRHPQGGPGIDGRWVGCPTLCQPRQPNERGTWTAVLGWGSYHHAECPQRGERRRFPEQQEGCKQWAKGRWRCKPRRTVPRQARVSLAPTRECVMMTATEIDDSRREICPSECEIAVSYECTHVYCVVILIPVLEFPT